MSLLGFQPNNCVAMLPIEWHASASRVHMDDLADIISILGNAMYEAIALLDNDDPEAARIHLAEILKTAHDAMLLH